MDGKSPNTGFSCILLLGAFAGTGFLGISLQASVLLPLFAGQPQV